VIPEANDAVPFVLDDTRSRTIDGGLMLSPIDFDDQLRPMTREVRDEIPYRNLPAKMLLFEALAQQPPQLALGISCTVPQPARARHCTSWRMMLQRFRPSTDITPP
jgi:hypothetical protein